MATPETKKKIHPPVALPKCPHATELPSPDAYGSIITVTVGEEETKRKFQVYEGLLKHYSTFFRAGLSNRWPEGSLKTMNLPEDDPEVFSAFFHWLSIGKLYSRLASDGTIPLTSTMIVKIYIFSDARGIPELCNAAVDLYFQKVNQDWIFPTYDLNFIYSDTPDLSPLRKYVVDEGIETFNFKYIKERHSEYPKEFLIDIMTEIVRQKKVPSFKLDEMGTGKYLHTKKLEICSKYHDHPGLETYLSS